MSSDEKKSPSIPAWQKSKTSEPEDSSTKPDSTDADTPSITSEPSTEQSLLEKASLFLEDPAIKDAPRDKKVAFLESKEIPRDEIEKLLPQSNGSTSTTTSSPSEPRKPTNPAKPVKDVAPVVTYPEFLAQRQKPDPLVTVSGVLTTAYVSAGVAAGLYGLSKYIVEPMVMSLTESRHDFAEHTNEHLTSLTGKLEGMVSTIPSKKQTNELDKSQGTEESESVSSDEDPTELFHRDCAVQTSPSLSRRGSSASANGNGADAAQKAAHETQAENLQSLHSRIQDLLETQEDAASSASQASSQVKDLTSYLQDMAFQSPYYSGHINNASYGGTSPSNWKKDDAAEALRTEIRGVKGMLLSARNFPSGSRSSAGKYLNTH